MHETVMAKKKKLKPKNYNRYLVGNSSFSHHPSAQMNYECLLFNLFAFSYCRA